MRRPLGNPYSDFRDVGIFEIVEFNGNRRVHFVISDAPH